MGNLKKCTSRVPSADLLRKVGHPSPCNSLCFTGLLFLFAFSASLTAQRDQVLEWPWRTDTAQRTISLDEFQVLLPPDAIPPVDKPRFESSAEALRHYHADEPVIAVVLDGESRAYPLSVLMWHEIVNDQIGQRFLSVTYCPLCNAAVVFDREFAAPKGGRYLLDFGTSGMLRHSDMVMWDRQTQSWWQQLTGNALVGRLAGGQLKQFPAQILSLQDYRSRWPAGLVLAKPTDDERPYGDNPYPGYDTESEVPAFYQANPDPRLPPTERVVDVCFDGHCRVYPWSMLAQKAMIQDNFQNQALVLFFRPGTRSALDQRAIALSRPIGSVGVYRAMLDGKALHFEPYRGNFRDRETGSVWDHTGRANAGQHKGRQLEPVLHHNFFAFAWFHFNPDSEVYQE
ncbi:MAG: DUF3179 domain-containing protein [Bacteroidetes bacterium]|nr:DUF3179 domain-containing protein [Bacteroidota bacterium]